MSNLNQTLEFSQTINFSSEKDVCANDMRKILVRSKMGKDGTPPKFAPFSVILPSAFLEPIAAVSNETFRDILLDTLDSLIRELASARKVQGFSSLKLEPDALKQFQAAQVSSRLSSANIQKWFDETIAFAIKENIAIEEKAEKMSAAYRIAFSKLAGSTSISNNDLEKMVNWVSKLDEESSNLPMTAKVLAEIESRIKIEDNLLD